MVRSFAAQPVLHPRAAATLALYPLALAAQDLTNALMKWLWWQRGCTFGLPLSSIGGTAGIAFITPPVFLFIGALLLWSPAIRSSLHRTLLVTVGVLSFAVALVGGFLLAWSGLYADAWDMRSTAFLACGAILVALSFLSAGHRAEHARLSAGAAPKENERSARELDMNTSHYPVSVPHPRYAATFALIPFALGGQWLLCQLWGLLWRILPPSGFAQVTSTLFFDLVPVAIFYGGALLIWAPTVWWSRKKKRDVWLASIALFTLTGVSSFWAWYARLLGFKTNWAIASIGCALALVLVSHVCWMPPKETRAGAAVPCRRCGYDLRGQRECRCPECGEQFTLSDLAREMAKIKA